MLFFCACHFRSSNSESSSDISSRVSSRVSSKLSSRITSNSRFKSKQKSTKFSRKSEKTENKNVQRFDPRSGPRSDPRSDSRSDPDPRSDDAATAFSPASGAIQSSSRSAVQPLRNQDRQASVHHAPQPQSQPQSQSAYTVHNTQDEALNEAYHTTVENIVSNIHSNSVAMELERSVTMQNSSVRDGDNMDSSVSADIESIDSQVNVGQDSQVSVSKSKLRINWIEREALSRYERMFFGDFLNVEHLF